MNDSPNTYLGHWKSIKLSKQDGYGFTYFEKNKGYDTFVVNSGSNKKARWVTTGYFVENATNNKLKIAFSNGKWTHDLSIHKKNSELTLTIAAPKDLAGRKYELIQCSLDDYPSGARESLERKLSAFQDSPIPRHE